MSWFNTGMGKLQELTEKAKSAAESVQKHIPVDRELLAKLTLNTDEMKAMRQQFGEEATHKAAVKDMLAGMLPWETKDAERDILVEECKEAILALSKDDKTFYGPYEMPELGVKVDDDDDDDDDEENEGDDENEDDAEGEKKKSVEQPKPSQESLEKLSKLEPLPPLLSDFDLDSHVGLIQRLFKEDPTLVEKQSTLSGGGPREKVFWHNYFFHCAYTRYEAGLSIDEIWSFNPDEDVKDAPSEPAAEAAVAEESAAAEDAADGEDAAEDDNIVDEPNSEIDEEINTENSFTAAAETSPGNSAGTSDYELVDEDAGEGSGDPELDELEAEIARELED